MNDKLVDIVHIGFMKTASTWFQLDLFPVIPDLVVLGKPFEFDDEYAPLINRFVFLPEYDFSPEQFRKEFERLHHKNLHRIRPEQKRIITHEFLSGEIYAGINSIYLLERIKRTFGDVKILMLIREQKSMIESVYKHYVKEGGSLHIRDLLYKRQSPSVDIASNKHLLIKFRYDKTIQFCYDTFGQQNVKVMLLEQLRDNRQQFLTEMFDFMDVALPDDQLYLGEVRNSERNTAPSNLAISMLRWINLILSTPLSDSPWLRPFRHVHTGFVTKLLLPVDKLIYSRVSTKRKFVSRRKYFLWERIMMTIFPRYKKSDMNALISDDIDRAYGESNYHTGKMLNMSLLEYGYFVTKPKNIVSN